MLLKKKILLFTALPVVLLLILWASCQWLLSHHAEGKLYHSVEAIPSRDVGVVLGCSEYLLGGRKNFFFERRIQAAASLYQAGKIKHILVSGDNRSRYYNEPKAMTNALIRQGIPKNRIHQDYAGFSTLDSIVRANMVFGLTKFTIISQPFHNRRAIFIAYQHHIPAIAYNAQSVSFAEAPKTWLREQLAVIKAVLDIYLLDRQPYFLGEPISITSS